MLPETASSTQSRPTPRTPARIASRPPSEPRPPGSAPAGRPRSVPTEAERSRAETIRQRVAAVLAISRERYPQDEGSEEATLALISPDTHRVATYEGRLLMPSEAAYAQLDAQLREVDLIALFRPAGKADAVPPGDNAFPAITVHVLKGRPVVKPRSPWLNIALLIATLFSVLIVGALIAAGEIRLSDPALSDAITGDLPSLLANLWRGIPYAVSILLILGAHELGHYFAARHHKIAVTLPYFIPAPFISPLGTFGAFIQLREPMRNRKVLIDVGAAGPLMGVLFAIPILLIGLATSQVGTLSPGDSIEGNSLLYALAKTLVFGRFLPDVNGTDVLVNQLAWAGWAGLLITALNLIPVGQLDGGHILYALLGERARVLYYPVLLALGVMAFLVSEVWLFWLILLFAFGRLYAVPLDTVTLLDRRRRWIGVLALLVFVVTFTPAPLTIYDPAIEGGLFREGAFQLNTVVTVMAVWLAVRVKR